MAGEENSGQKAPRRHTIRLRVRQSDTDYLGIVYNPVYLDYAMEAAFQHVASCSFNIERIHELGGYFVVRRHEIEYLRPARAGDELLVTTHLASMKGLRATRETIIVDGKTGAVLARAKTDYVWVRENGRPGHVPRAILDAFDWSPDATNSPATAPAAT